MLNLRLPTTAVKETWASHCDGFVALSDNGFDWFVLGGDDLSLIVENLVTTPGHQFTICYLNCQILRWFSPLLPRTKYLLSDDIKHAAGGLENGGPNPMCLGRRFRFIGEKRIYNNGGPSYVLNQASVGQLPNHLDDDACQSHAAKHWEGILFEWYRMPKKPEGRLFPGCVVCAWYIIQGIDPKFGRECCSQESLSFHYVGEQVSRRLHDLIYARPKYQADAAVVARV
ncbi:unnamed protein product [Ectocarpus sp. CCAP 1310/34]|nr:unnamed protein product [Ectocarpus sp. CCAP 1310/34]